VPVELDETQRFSVSSRSESSRCSLTAGSEDGPESKGVLFLEVTESDIKNSRSVAGSSWAGTARGANKVTIVGSGCAEERNPQTKPSAILPTPGPPQNPKRGNESASGPSGMFRKK